MQGQTTDMLKQMLRDIHTPEPVSSWPPAIGWWILALLTLLIATAVGLWLRRRRNANRYRLAASAQLQHHFAEWQDDQDSIAYLQSAAAILKRSMRHVSDNPAVLTQSGEEWVAVLDQLAPTALSDAARHGLSQQLYQAHAEVDVVAIHAELSNWLRHHTGLPQPHKLNQKPITSPSSEVKNA